MPLRAGRLYAAEIADDGWVLPNMDVGTLQGQQLRFFEKGRGAGAMTAPVGIFTVEDVIAPSRLVLDNTAGDVVLKRSGFTTSPDGERISLFLAAPRSWLLAPAETQDTEEEQENNAGQHLDGWHAQPRSRAFSPPRRRMYARRRSPSFRSSHAFFK